MDKVICHLQRAALRVFDLGTVEMAEWKWSSRKVKSTSCLPSGRIFAFSVSGLSRTTIGWYLLATAGKFPLKTGDSTAES